MAKSKSQNGTPEGFQRILDPDRFYWLKEYDGKPQPIQGVIVGRAKRWDWDDDDEATHRYYYTLRLTKPTVARVYDEKNNQQDVPVVAGKNLIVDETAELAKIVSAVEAVTLRGQSLEVIITPINKRSIGSGRSVWRITVDARAIDMRPSVGLLTTTAPKQQLQSGDDDLPF